MLHTVVKVKYVGRALSKIHFERKHTKNDIKAKPTKKTSSYSDAVTPAPLCVFA